MLDTVTWKLNGKIFESFNKLVQLTVTKLKYAMHKKLNIGLPTLR